MKNRMIVDAVIMLTDSSKTFQVHAKEGLEVRQDSVCGTMLKAWRAANNAEVVRSDVFATSNSLRTHVSRTLIPLFSNNHAKTRKLCTRSNQTVVENHSISNASASFKSP